MLMLTFQRAAGGGIAASNVVWNGLIKVGGKVSRPSNAQRDFRPLSRECVC